METGSMERILNEIYLPMAHQDPKLAISAILEHEKVIGRNKRLDDGHIEELRLCVKLREKIASQIRKTIKVLPREVANII